MEERFTTGGTLACWMIGLGTRLELLQVPRPRPAADAFGEETYTGYYHISFDLTQITDDLSTWLAARQADFLKQQGFPLKVLLSPQQQLIGSHVYEVAFIADGDGLPLELLRCLT